MIYVTKRDGRKEPFERGKIIRTCLRTGASREVAEKIAVEVEKRIYNGITTDEILKMVIRLLEKRAYSHAAKYDLKMALLRLGPEGFEFEKFVAGLLKMYGYRTETNLFVEGRCVTHEIDVIAEKGGKRYLIECKFHNLPGIYTGLKDVMYTYSRLLDIRDGFRDGKNHLEFEGFWVFTNTKFSEDAKKFGRCRNILLTGWNYPENRGIEKMLEEKNLYPVTVLRGLDKFAERALINSGYVFCREIVQENLKELSRKTGLRLTTLKKLIKEGEMLCKNRIE